MNELQLSSQMEISGGGIGTVVFCVVIGAAVYKISIPRIISIEWR